MMTHSEETLIFRIRQGDRKSFQKLYSDYHTALSRAITTIVSDPTEAEDLLQDTYLKVWKHFHTYNPDRGSLFTWLLNVARNTALDSIRRRKLAQVTLSIDSDRQVAAVSYQPVPDTIGVRYVVMHLLSLKQWQVIDLRYWQGYTNKEIAERLVLPIPTVKSRIHQSLIRLRPFFDGSC